MTNRDHGLAGNQVDLALADAAVDAVGEHDALGGDHSHFKNCSGIQRYGSCKTNDEFYSQAESHCLGTNLTCSSWISAFSYDGMEDE